MDIPINTITLSLQSINTTPRAQVIGDLEMLVQVELLLTNMILITVLKEEVEGVVIEETV